MSDIAELERRITAALDRIAAGTDRLQAAAAPETAAHDPVPVPAPESGAQAELAELREALAAERATNAQLEERVKTVRERQGARVATLEAELAEARETIEQVHTRIQEVRKVNQQLRHAAQKLREASAEATPDPHLLNQTMLAELESLRAIRAEDRAEMDVLLNRLAPLLDPDDDDKEAADA